MSDYGRIMAICYHGMAVETAPRTDYEDDDPYEVVQRLDDCNLIFLPLATWLPYVNTGGAAP